MEKYVYLKSKAFYDSCAKNEISRISECYTAMEQVMYILLHVCNTRRRGQLSFPSIIFIEFSDKKLAIRRIRACTWGNFHFDRAGIRPQRGVYFLF